MAAPAVEERKQGGTANKMMNSIRIDQNVAVEMRDGVILRADVFRPNDNGRHPAILTRTPYNKALWEYYPYWGLFDTISAGYARVVQDVRGRYASGGEWRRSALIEVEVPDGYDTVEWIARQPWCDGNVGMVGASYMGFLQWTTAIDSSPHLKAIAPEVATSGWSHKGPLRDATLTGAPTYLSFLTYWSLQMAYDIIDKLEKNGRDVSRMRKLFARALSDPEKVYSHLPLKDAPLFQFKELGEMWQNLILHIAPETDLGEKAFWPYHRINVPILNVCGWYDVNAFGAFRNFLGMKQKGGSEYARKNQYIYMGPWRHAGQATDYLGEMVFGAQSAAPGPRATLGIGVSKDAPVSGLYLDFFNKYLKGIDSRIPAITYFVMGKNEWRTAEEWPLPETQWQRFFLHSKGHANTSAGDGLLSRQEPDSESPDTFVYDPQFPVPTVGGRVMGIGAMITGPRDQYHVARRNDVVCYTTSELTEDVEITGELKMHLFASSSARDTDFTAQLVDVYPDGRAYNLADGIIRARHRKGYWREDFITPGEVYELTIDMAVTSHVFKQGHRIRIDVSSSSFPAWERNMNTGNPVGEDACGIPAMQTVLHEKEYASYIDFPIIPQG